jgi:hypothetical protein
MPRKLDMHIEAFNSFFHIGKSGTGHGMAWQHNDGKRVVQEREWKDDIQT